MNTQKKPRKKLEGYKDRGDMLRNDKELQAIPRDRGDVKRKIAKDLKTKAGTVKTLITRSTNTIADTKLSNAIKVDVRSEKCLNFRKRVEERYTFKRHQVLNRDETNDMSKFNRAMKYDVKNALPKFSNSGTAEKQKSEDHQEAKKSDKASTSSVHRAISVMKVKHTSKCELSERKKSPEDKKEKRPVIKTVTSKDTRVYKAVTFVEDSPRKPLHVKIPKDLKPKKSKITTLIPVSNTVKLRKRRTPQPSPSSKSADSLPTEIAKWVPESVDQHTKPYYEAWVSKTATASTKLVQEANLEKSKVLISMELQRKSPELIHKTYKEEEYAGRIRVTRRGEK